MILQVPWVLLLEVLGLFQHIKCWPRPWELSSYNDAINRRRITKEDSTVQNLNSNDIYLHSCFLKWWYPQSTPKWSFLTGKPMVVGYPHFRKHPYGIQSLNFFFKRGTFPPSKKKTDIYLRKTKSPGLKVEMEFFDLKHEKSGLWKMRKVPETNSKPRPLKIGRNQPERKERIHLPVAFPFSEGQTALRFQEKEGLFKWQGFRWWNIPREKTRCLQCLEANGFCWMNTPNE